MMTTTEQMRRVNEVFLAYDIRGSYPTLLNEKVMMLVGEILGTDLISSSELLIGYDNRTSSIPLANALITGLKKSKVTLKSAGFIANGAMYYAAWKMKIPAAYITASHVPPPTNGLKLIRSDGTSFLEELQVIKERFLQKIIEVEDDYFVNSEEPCHPWASSNFRSIIDENVQNVQEEVKSLYFDFLLSVLKEDEFDHRLSIAIDAMNGATSSVLRPFFSKVEYLTPLLLHCPPPDEVPLDYGGIIPEPTPKSASELIDMIKDQNMDFGVVFDGDGDRSLFIDDKGRPLDGTLMTAVFARFLLNDYPGGTVIVPVDATQALTDVVLERGGNVEYVRIGHSFIEQAIKKNDVILCGESSHHYYFPRFCPFSDGILSMLVLSHYLALENIKLSQIIDSLPRYELLRKNISFNTHSEKKDRFDFFRKEVLDMFDHEQLTLIDGVKVSIDSESWFLARPSNTEPLIRLIVESRDKDRANSLMKTVEGWLRSGQPPQF